MTHPHNNVTPMASITLKVSMRHFFVALKYLPSLIGFFINSVLVEFELLSTEMQPQLVYRDDNISADTRFLIV